MKFGRGTTSDLRDLIAYHNAKQEIVALDLETEGLDTWKDKLTHIAITGYEPESALVFEAVSVQELKHLVCPLVLHNFKFDYKVLHRQHAIDLRINCVVKDTMLIHHLVDENELHDLDTIIKFRYGDDYKSLFWSKYASYSLAPSDEQLVYACKDVVYTRRLYLELVNELHEQGIPDTLVEHQHKLALAAYDFELNGLRVDVPHLMQMGTELKADIIKTESELRLLGGIHCELREQAKWVAEMAKRKTAKGKAAVPKPEFNFTSNADIQDLLYNRLGLPKQYSKKTKALTADDKAIERLGDAHPILPALRRNRKYTKMYGSFIEGILNEVRDERVYPYININGTVTGRVSHSSPNMAQIPAKDEWSKIRGIFVPDPGHKLLSLDYGQLEICLTAHFSNDPVLLALVRSGESMHDKTTAELAEFGVTRPMSKAINFGIIYGAQEHKIAHIVGCSVDKAKDILGKFWGLYTGLKAAIDECHARVDRGEPIVSPFGRRRRFPTRFKNKWEAQAAKRQAFNSLVQGTGADLTSRAYYLTAERLKGLGYGRALYTVHDELVVQVQDRVVEWERDIIQATMVSVGEEIDLRVPLTVDCSEGLERWAK